MLELVAGNGDLPENVAIAALVYSAFTWIAMALYGVDAWIERGEAFSVYFNLFSRISPFERRGGEVGLRRPLSGLAALAPAAGNGAAAGRDDRLGLLRRLLGVGRLEQRRRRTSPGASRTSA